MRAPGLFPRRAPLRGLGRGVVFGIPCPCSGSGPRPTHTPDGSLLKIGGNKRCPVQGMNDGGPQTEAGRGLPENTPSVPCKGGVWRVKTPPPPPPKHQVFLYGNRQGRNVLSYVDIKVNRL